MKERPILYSAPMVLAKLAGTKTQTRRVVKHDHIDEADRFAFDPERGEWELGETHQGPVAHVGWMRCPYGAPGDRLWGREAWGLRSPGDPTDWYRGSLKKLKRHPDLRASLQLEYRASWEVDDGSTFWRPNIFMYRSDSRILDEVVSVRVERLQDISDDDAIDEGLERRSGSPNWFWPGGLEGFGSPRACYLCGWDTINGKGAAAKNPWVWAIETKPLKPPIS